jgi:hypothetical protein
VCRVIFLAHETDENENVVIGVYLEHLSEN